MVAGCRVHYLLWAREPARSGGRGLLFVHGGGAHSHWWSDIAPYFTRDFRVAAIDLSGMGDSGGRARYNSDLRASEIQTVIAAAQLGERPFIIGHSFGGFMTMRVASQYGEKLGGAVIVDSPIRSPEEEARHPLTRPPMGNKRVYETFDAALVRFRLAYSPLVVDRSPVLMRAVRSRKRAPLPPLRNYEPPRGERYRRRRLSRMDLPLSSLFGRA
jgi:pimeloyl-ACP methyl ester carboxylesterase